MNFFKGIRIGDAAGLTSLIMKNVRIWSKRKTFNQMRASMGLSPNSEFHHHLVYNILNTDTIYLFNSVKHSYETNYGVIKDFDSYNNYYVQKNTNNLTLDYNLRIQTCSPGQTKYSNFEIGCKYVTSSYNIYFILNIINNYFCKDLFQN